MKARHTANKEIDMKYDTKTTKAIEESIAHHEKNLHDLETLEGEFKRGFFRDGNGNSLLIGKEKISFHGDTCALCSLFDCCEIEGCPLDKIGLGCNEYNSLWKKIIRSESRPEAITTTKGMIKALRGLVEVPSKFKVDDTVKIVRSGWGCGPEMIGKLAVIISVTPSKWADFIEKYTYKIKCGD